MPGDSSPLDEERSRTLNIPESPKETYLVQEELDKRSFENIVWFYQDELYQITDRRSATEVFTKGLRRRLLDLGVLVYKRGRRGLRYILSATAQEFLQTLAAGAPSPARPPSTSR